jgi:CP family cyanate transporter-like MFS transporter
MSSIWWLLKVRSTERPGKKIDLPKFHLSTFRNFGAWSIGLFFGIQSLIYYSTATWFPTILISKGFTSNDAGFAVAATGLIGALVGILAPHYASKLPNIRGLLVALSFMLAISFIGLIVDTGWHLVIWLVVASIALSITFPLSLMLAVTRGVGPGETRSLSIMSQSVGYALAFFGPGLVGATFDASKNWNVALVVPLLFSLILALIGYFAGKPEKIHLR